MARSPANRLAIEAELSDSELLTLASFCEVAGVERDGWHLIPAARDFWETLAAFRIVARLTSDGRTKEGATTAAALMLDLEPDTLRSRFDRLRRAAREMRQNAVGDSAEAA